MHSGRSWRLRNGWSVFMVALCGVVGVSWAQDVTIATDQADGIYHVGDTVVWTVTWHGDGEVPEASYAIKSGGRSVLQEGSIAFADRSAEIESQLDEPNTHLLEVTWRTGADARRAMAGAVAAPDEIQPAVPEPDDFLAFWRTKLSELDKVPAHPRLQSVDVGIPGVDYWKITLDNINGTHVHGQLARPSEGNSLPALLILQYAGVYPLQKAWATDRAAEGWLVLNILAHDLPIDEAAEFYQQQSSGPLSNYWQIGNDNRDSSYYLRMYLSCSQALRYLKSRSDWDGETLVVMGTSQGGHQALVTAGLHPEDVTAVIPFLPAGCDMLAPSIGRAAGFPDWWSQTAGKDAEKVRQTSRYFDPVYFAARIRCPMLCGLGLSDELAPPSSILAATNAARGPKEVMILVAGHSDENGSHQPFYDRCYGVWLPALRTGNTEFLSESLSAVADE